MTGGLALVNYSGIKQSNRRRRDHLVSVGSFIHVGFMYIKNRMYSVQLYINSSSIGF